MEKLSLTYYQQNDVVSIAKDLLGKILCTRFNGNLTKVLITETEAYEGEIDKASHAYGGKRTKRTDTMYQLGGICYVYLCYGIHHLFNVVTGAKDLPHAVLIRGGVGIYNTPIIEKRRGIKKMTTTY